MSLWLCSLYFYIHFVTREKAAYLLFEKPYKPNKGRDINRCVVDLSAAEAVTFSITRSKKHVPLWRNPRALILIKSKMGLVALPLSVSHFNTVSKKHVICLIATVLFLVYLFINENWSIIE